LALAELRKRVCLKSPVGENRTPGSVRGRSGDWPSYCDGGFGDGTMSDIESKVGEVIRDSKRLERLLALEKQRRGVPANGLAFVGMHNVAQHWWCTQQAVLKSRANEIQFFSAYLYDRIVYAHRLGLVDKLPR